MRLRIEVSATHWVLVDMICVLGLFRLRYIFSTTEGAFSSAGR